jgi:hypothetical protein
MIQVFRFLTPCNAGIPAYFQYHIIFILMSYQNIKIMVVLYHAIYIFIMNSC